MTTQGSTPGKSRQLGRPGSGRREASWGDVSDWLDDWLAIEPDGTINVYSGKVELGTGVRTALAQIVADELDMPLERIRMIMGDTYQTPDEGYTAGSATISGGGSALRNAAAEARRAMMEMAAERLDATAAELVVQAGAISVKDRPERSVTYAELMGGRQFRLRVTGTAPKKAPRDYQVVGTPVPREDLPGKVAGAPSFIHDMRLPGMLHGRMVRPPGPAAELVSVDESSVKDLPGLIKVVRLGNFLGAVAETEIQAIDAAKRLRVEWQPLPAYPAMQDLYAYLKRQPTDDTVLVDEGDVEAALAAAAKRLSATYYQPYHAHASIGPSCAVAEVTHEEATIWSSTPGPYPLGGAIAQLLEMPPERVHMIFVEGAGSYGQNGADDAAADAAILSREIGGRPVRVQWTREDEFVWEPKAPAMVMEARAGLDEKGNIVAWDYHVTSPSHVARARLGGQLIAGQLISRKRAPASRFSFGAERNAPTNYTFPVQRVTVHYLQESPLRASSFRSLGGGENSFANESFMDELAAAAAADPVEFRLRYLKGERERAVLQAAAQKAGWEAHPSHQKDAGDLAAGRGVAFVRYENDQALVAAVAEVEVARASGMVRVKRFTVAHDCGLIINPDGVRNQVEGNVIQSLSRTLKEEVQFNQEQVTSINWESYKILTFSEVPDIQIVLINRPEEEAVGAGEPSTTTTAAAVANAIFDATGVRLRQIPFTPERVKAQLEAQ